jgi:Zn finger protein HypA/HybF involved in hydrogenase expression
VEDFLNSGLETLEPAIEMSGTPTYPKLKGLEQYPASKVQAALNQLVESRVLLKELYEKLVACPHCHQPSKVFIRTKCPKCGSHKVRMNRLTEHVKCGAIYKRQEYTTPNGLKCPKCGKTAEEVELKPVGVVFECELCGNTFGDPVQTFHCRRCAAEFEFKSGELVDTYAYTLNKEAKSEAQETLTVLNIAEAIEKLGYKTNIPGYLKGKTGVKQEFTLTCTKQDKVTAIDLAMSGGKIDLTTILTSYAKFIDIPNTAHLLIAIPSLEPKAKDFLNANQIPYIEGDNLNQITEKLKQHLK